LVNIFTSQCFNIVIDRHIRPMVIEYRPAERFAFTHSNNVAPSSFKCQVHTSDP
jgi:hypothetical protein